MPAIRVPHMPPTPASVWGRRKPNSKLCSAYRIASGFGVYIERDRRRKLGVCFAAGSMSRTLTKLTGFSFPGCGPSGRINETDPGLLIVDRISYSVHARGGFMSLIDKNNFFTRIYTRNSD